MIALRPLLLSTVLPLLTAPSGPAEIDTGALVIAEAAIVGFGEHRPDGG